MVLICLLSAQSSLQTVHDLETPGSIHDNTSRSPQRRPFSTNIAVLLAGPVSAKIWRSGTIEGYRQDKLFHISFAKLDKSPCSLITGLVSTVQCALPAETSLGRLG